ncbi:kinase-like domain-containing protein [Suillus subluteus]|nr:kinase-like domain-containing protein [Suillus subluteus]
METTEELQQLEITALKSIYDTDFFEPPPPKAWKGATRLPEFIIKVTHPDSDPCLRSTFTCIPDYLKHIPPCTPVFTIQKPRGINHDHEITLQKAIHSGSELRGSEMVFQNESDEKRRAEKEFELAAQRAEELQEQIQADAQRHILAKEMQYKAARRRAQSDATEVPSSGDTLTESFPSEIEFRGNTYLVEEECLGITYLADPLCDDVNATLPLEVHTINFNSDYYTTTQGKKKLHAAEAEIQKLINIQHPNLLSTLAVKLNFPYSGAPPRMTILSEQRPALTLQDVLEDCERLREDRASEYLGQILSALNAVHSADIIHRGLDISCIYLATRENRTHTKMVRLGKVGYHARLKDYHKSNPFGNGISNVNEEEYTSNTLSVLSYTRGRDIHSVGVIFMQMVDGRDVMRQFSDPNEAVQAAALSPTLRTCALNMLMHAKKVSCLSLLAELASAVPLQSPRRIGIPTTIPFINTDLRSPKPNGYFGSPENDYFRIPQRTAPASRWKEDWEELELLGRVPLDLWSKLETRLIIASMQVKKIRLRSDKDDNKLFREVNALSRLSHRFIYNVFNSDTGSDSGTEGGMTSVPKSYERETSDPFKVKLEDLDDYGSNKTSFPSIHFTRPEIKNFGNLFSSEYTTDEDTPKDPIQPRTLYIQMEFVERQTLKERVAEGLSEEEAWRLFYQILDALLHRDIKLTNIFIDGKGDCKGKYLRLGDFGLATSSLAAVDPSDLSPSVVHSDSELTLEVGTKLYIAPEVQSRKRGPRNHNKADMYSLGIVFFEMNFSFSTGAERIAVLEDLRKPEVYFPRDWNPHRSSQKQIIAALLRHDPAVRPNALELSQSPLLPPRVEDEYFKGALRMMTKPDSPYHQGVLSALFNQPVNQARSYLYDIEAEIPEHAYLNDIVEDRIAAIFRLHGAVDMEPPLLIPSFNPEECQNHATLIDRHGEMVCLPNNALVPFARLAARAGLRRIKRFHITNIYRPNSAPGHPKATKAAVLDVITPDTKHGLMAAGAEFLILLSNCLNSFPNLAQNYEIHISHSKIADLALNRIPEELRSSVIEIINQSKSTAPQKRVSLLKKGLLRSTTDELEALAEIGDLRTGIYVHKLIAGIDEDIDILLSKLEKVSPTLVTVMKPAVEEIKQTIQFATSAGFSAPVFFHPLMWGAHHMHFKEGVRIEVVRRTRRLDVLAAAGRYDNLIAQYSNPKPRSDPICAFAMQIALEKIAMVLAAFQSTSVKALVKEQRSFGFWSPRRCDVYVLSYQAGYLQDRLEVASLLWQNNISADIMYDANLVEFEHVDLCTREGILFAIYPRPRTVRREQAAFKVKSILKGTVYEVSRQDLVGWLQHQIAEQKRVDLATSGSSAYPDTLVVPVPSKDASAPEVHLILPVDTKKQKKHVKQMLLDRAYERAGHLKTAVQNGLPMLAVDVPNAVFDTLMKNASWITDEETWKGITASMPTVHMAYAQQIREAAAKRKAEGFPYLLFYATREERMQILTLN